MAAISLAAAARALWRRAPAWRFALMSAAVATLVFALFPPQWQQPDAAPEAVPAARYAAQPRVAPPAAVAPGAATAATAKPAPRQPAPRVAPPTAAVTQAGEPKAAALSLATPGGSSGADNSTGLADAMTGKLYSGSVRAAGFDVPLPEGRWVILANGAMKPKDGTRHHFGVIYYLGRIERKQLAGVVIVYAVSDRTDQAITATEPLKIQPGCNATDRAYMYKPDDYDENLPLCWDLHTHFMAGMRRWADRAAPMSNLERSAAGDLAAKGVEMPQEMMVATYILTRKWGLLYTSYEFSPDFEGIKSTEVPGLADSDWSPANIGRYPEKLAYQEKIRQWGAVFWPKVQAAFMAAAP